MAERFSNNNENRLFLNNSHSSKTNEDNFVFANLSQLPQKKRFGAKFLNFMREPDTQENPLIEKQQTFSKTGGMEHNLQKRETRKVAP